jgi:hypothetical protein
MRPAPPVEANGGKAALADSIRALPEPRARTGGDISAEHPGFAGATARLARMAKTPFSDNNGALTFGLHNRGNSIHWTSTQ